MIYQKHPNHGRHVAANDREERDNIKNGWKTISKDEFYGLTPAIEGESEEINEDELSEREKLALNYEIKFGKKPPHNMKTENIKAKLDE